MARLHGSNDSLRSFHVANITQLASLPNITIGVTCWVDTLECLWESCPSNTATTDGYTVINGQGVQWQRIEGSSSSKWLSQNTWYIDGIAGNDENDGYTSGTALKTADELQRRWGSNAILNQSTTINFQPGTYSRCFLEAKPANSTVMLTIQGITTALVTTTIFSFAPYTHGTYGVTDPEATIVSATGVSDWTSYAVFSNRLRSNTKLAHLAKVNPAGGGISTLRTQPWGIIGSTGSMLYTQSNPSVSDPLVIEQLPTIINCHITFEGAAASTGVQLLIQHLAFSGSFTAKRGRENRCRVFGCSFGSSCAGAELSENKSDLQRFMACEFRNIIEGDFDIWGCLLFGTITPEQNSDVNIISCLSQGVSIFNIFNTNSFLYFSDLQIFDCSLATGTIQTFPGCVIQLFGQISGKNIGPGFSLNNNAKLVYSQLPNLISSVTGTADVIVYKNFGTSTPESRFHWSDCPSSGVLPQDIKWTSRSTWYIDATLGDDSNFGDTSGSPLKTADEIQRRWGPNPLIPQAVTVNVLSTAIDHIYLNGQGLDSTCSITIQGTAVPVLTTTISAFTPYSHGTYGSVSPTPTILSMSGIVDNTSYVGKRAHSGTLFSWLDITNPNGGGLGTVSSSPWGSIALTGTMAFTQANPSVSNSITIENLTTINNININWTGADGYSISYPWVLVKDFNIIKSITINKPNREGHVRIYGCKFENTAFALANTKLASGLNPIFASCYLLCNMASNQNSVFGGLLLNAAPYLKGGPGNQVYQYCLSRSTTNSPCWWGDANPFYGGFLDSQGFANNNTNTNANIFIFQGFGTFQIINSSGIAGTNCSAIRLVDGCSVIFDSSQSYNFIPGTGLGELQTYGSAALFDGGFKFSDCLNGLQPGKWSGQVTLVGGVANITLSPKLTSLFTTTSKITLTIISANNSLGVHTITNRTTSGFTIQSSSAMDNSTVFYSVESSINRSEKIMPASLV